MFLRFLDWLNVGNFVGPEELEKKVPNAEEKFAEFMKTPQGQASFNEEILPYVQTPPTEEITTEPTSYDQETPSFSEEKPEEELSGLNMNQLASALGLETPLEPDTKIILSQLLKYV